MKNLIKLFFMALFFFCLNMQSFSQDTTNYKLQFSINFGANFFYDGDGYSSRGEVIQMNAQNFELSYLYKNHEIGLTLGKSDYSHLASYPTDTSFTTFTNIVKPINIIWYGLDYKYKIKNCYIFGIKLCLVEGGQAYHELSFGKQINILNNVNIKFTINYSVVTYTLLNFAHTNDTQLGANFGISFKLF